MCIWSRHFVLSMRDETNGHQSPITVTDYFDALNMRVSCEQRAEQNRHFSARVVCASKRVLTVEER